jgi:hypothetical protein
MSDKGWGAQKESGDCMFSCCCSPYICCPFDAQSFCTAIMDMPTSPTTTMTAPNTLKRKLKQPQSPLACEACRAKKVRCDATLRRSRCTRCERSNVSCNIVPGRRRHLVHRILSEGGNGFDNAPTLSASDSPVSIGQDTADGVRFGSVSMAAAKPELSPSTDSYLKNLGCYDIPSLESRQQSLEAYKQWIHPSMPLLEPVEVFCAADGAASPLLLKAAIAATSAFLETSNRGLEVLTRQVEAMIAANTEKDPLVVLQSLLLMTFCGSGKKDEYFWLGIANRCAQQIMQESEASKKRQVTIRRTLWCLLSRDVAVSLAKRMPCQVSKSFCSPVEYEAAVSPWDIENQSDEMEVTFANDIIRKSQAELFLLARDILQCKFEQQDARVQQLSDSLVRWHDQWYSSLACLPDSQASRVHRTVLQGYWSLAVVTLHCWSQGPVSVSGAQKSASVSALVARAINGVTDAYQDLFEADLVQYIPSTAVAALTPAAAAHLVNSMSQDSQDARASGRKYYICWQVLRELRPKYDCAAQVMTMIDALGQNLRQSKEDDNADRLRRLRERTSSFCGQLEATSDTQGHSPSESDFSSIWSIGESNESSASEFDFFEDDWTIKQMPVAVQGSNWE